MSVNRINFNLFYSCYSYFFCIIRFFKCIFESFHAFYFDDKVYFGFTKIETVEQNYCKKYCKFLVLRYNVKIAGLILLLIIGMVIVL